MVPVAGQGLETFDNLELSGTSYADGSFVGQDGITWTYVQCRGDMAIDGKAIMIGRNRDDQSHFYSSTISGGIGTLSFDYMQAYSTDVNLNVLVNDNVVATVTTSGEQNQPKESGEITVNVAGDFVIKFINVNNGDGQVVVDNIQWTAYDGSSAGELSNFQLSSYDLQTGEDVELSWEAEGVEKIDFQLWDEDAQTWEDIEGLTDIDASLGSISFTIPLSATDDDNVKLRIVDASNSAVFAESDPVKITDVHFTDVYLTYPEDAATDLKTDLFVISDDGQLSLQSIIIGFAEEVEANTGTANLYKTEDDELVKSWDVQSDIQIYDQVVVVMTIGENLEANTQYRVEIGEGVLVDKSAAQNENSAISWTFTTGADDSFYTISEIRGEQEEAPLMLDETVMTSGVVTGIYGTSGFFIQDGTDPWSGIYVYDPDWTESVTVGDSVVMVGTVSEYNDLAQLQNLVHLEVVSQGHSFEPVVVTLPFTEQWEGMLIKVENVAYTDADISYGEFEISDGTNTGKVDNLFIEYTPEASEEFGAIIGILNYSYGEYKIAPRSEEDLEEVPTGVADISFVDLQIWPNPAGKSLYIRTHEAITSIEMVNLAGKTVKFVSPGGADYISVDVSDLPRGIYLVRIVTLSGRKVVNKVVLQ